MINRHTSIAYRVRDEKNLMSPPPQSWEIPVAKLKLWAIKIIIRTNENSLFKFILYYHQLKNLHKYTTELKKLQIFEDFFKIVIFLIKSYKY